MKIGLVARADNSGLGIQTHEFYKHMHPIKTMVVDISDLNHNTQYPERYDGEDVQFVKGFPKLDDINQFLTGLDVVFIAESAYNPYLYVRAKELGVKTAVQHNWEFFDWLSGDVPLPDMFISPSKWHYEDVQKFCDENHIRHVYLHCPVNRDVLPYREIRHAKTFLHVAGRSAAHDRNGTMTVIQAAQYLESGAEILIHFQGEQGLKHQATHSYADYLKILVDLNITNVTMMKIEHENYQDVYREGDVLLLPRRYGGNCLPMNEALSKGMPVLMPHISPNDEFLPHVWLMPAEKIGEFTPRTKVDIYDVDPKVLAERIDEFYYLDEATMLQHNDMADTLGAMVSWEVQRHLYLREFEILCSL